MLELINIDKRFGRLQALCGVGLSAREGTIHGLIGENGAGKSTLMKVLTGFVRMTGGEIRLRGNRVHPGGPRDAMALGIGMLYQEPLDFPQLSVLENFIAGQAGYDPAAARQRLARLARDFSFHLRADDLVGDLTVGERQQLELLRLIDGGARVLILDEPTTGISAQQQEMLFAALRRLKATGATVLLVSHKLEEIDLLCDEVTVLRHGQVVARRSRPFDRDDLLRAMFDVLPEREGATPKVAAGPPLLIFDRACAGSGRSALAGLSLTIGRGEIVGLAGIDGSGQNTFLKLAAGLLAPTSGEVRLEGEDCGPIRRPTLGVDTVYLPADRLTEGLFPQLSLREHHVLATPGRALLTPSAGLEDTRRAIAMHGIKGEAQQPVQDLSGGNQQRLLLSLIPEKTRLILMENPTRGLDVHSARSTWTLLRRRLEGQGAAIIFASPDLDEVMREASRILVFSANRVVLDIPAREASSQVLSRAITGQVDALVAP